MSSSLKTRSRALYLAGIALNVGFAGFLAVALGTAARLRTKGRAWSKAIAPELLAAAVLFAGFLVLPSSSLGVVNLGERLLYPALLLIVLKLRELPFAGVLASLLLVGAGLTSVELLTMPAQQAGSATAYPVSMQFMPDEKYQKFGLYSHELFVNDDRRSFLEAPTGKALPELRFDTSAIRER